MGMGSECGPEMVNGSGVDVGGVKQGVGVDNGEEETLKDKKIQCCFNLYCQIF